MARSLTHLYAAGARNQEASSIREICKLVARPEMRSLAGGWPGRETFPIDELAQIAAEVLARHGADALQYGMTEGLLPLRERVAAWAREREHMDCGPDNLLIVHGSQQGMDLAFRLFIEPGDVALAGLPTYFGGTGALKALGANLVGIPLDGQGIDVIRMADVLARQRTAGARVKLVYVIPDFQNPTGQCLAPDRRRRLLELAVEHDFVIVEDDPYGDLRFEGTPLPTLRSLERDCGAEGRVIHIHSFSKVFAPGLRLAWVAAEPEVVRRLVILKQYVDCCTNTFAQHLLLGFLERGGLERRIATNIAHYRGRRDVMLDAIARHFPAEVRSNRPQGGFFVFSQLPPRLDADELMAEALAQNVAFVSGRQFHLDGSGRHTFRLSYSQSGPAVIEAAVAGIGRLIRERLAH